MRNTWAAITAVLLAVTALWILVDLTSQLDGGLLVVEAWAAIFGFLAISTAGKVLRLTRAMRDLSLHWFLDRHALIARRAGQPVVTFVIGESARAELTALPRATVR
ncbi:MAG TPA: hypothetical protein VIU61_19450 [Kofleriaceae bacterium]